MVKSRNNLWGKSKPAKKIALRAAAAVMIVLTVCPYAIGAIPALERQVLIALYNGTGGDLWTNNTGWKTPPLDADGFAMPGTENTWFGITCDAEDTTVTGIELGTNNLVGTIPTEIGNLAGLISLNLSANDLDGPIPPEIGNLSNLETLILYTNYLGGRPSLFSDLPAQDYPIPPEIGDLTNLVTLELWNNRLAGSIPAELCGLAKLEHLILDFNRLTGTIPTDIINLTNLKSLGLLSNDLTGPIPVELASLTKLESLGLGYNQLTGYIPAELGNLPRIKDVFLQSNQLTGPIPAKLEDLTTLNRLNLSQNQLTGSIPPGLGNLQGLYSLELGSNQLTGPIPAELGNLMAMDLDLSYNLLTGSIPPELGNMLCWNLSLSNNRLTGRIPTELGNIRDIYSLKLNGNQLIGPVPASLANLTQLYQDSLDISYNALYANDEELVAFLNSCQTGGDWQSTQTIVPTDVAARAIDADTVRLSWSPIEYADDPGGYEIYQKGSTVLMGVTANKSADTLAISGLKPGTEYTFVVRSKTESHAENQNTVYSEFSEEVTVTTDGIPTSGGGGGGCFISTALGM